MVANGPQKHIQRCQGADDRAEDEQEVLKAHARLPIRLAENAKVSQGVDGHGGAPSGGVITVGPGIERASLLGSRWG